MRKTIYAVTAQVFLLFLLSYSSAFAGVRTIAKVEPVNVNSPVGTVPRLPYQVWVTYSDGKSEYRQAKWSNAALTTEQTQANPSINPVGSEYTITGFIIGDNTTENGYPILANIKVVAEPYAVPSKPVAETVPMNKVVVNGDNRLSSNRDRAIEAILSWDVAQQLYNYRDTYGLSTEGYPVSDGWDSPTTKLKGHGSGHYMSSLAFAFAGATNEEQKNALRKNITRMVNELRECQERTFVKHPTENRFWEARDFAPEAELREMQGSWEAFDVHKTKWETYGYGYLNAIPAHHPALIEMYRAYNNVNWVWAPYYSIHKQLAGLIDIATYMDDPAVAAKALLIAKDMGLWIWNRMHYRTYIKTDGTQDERRANPGNRYEMWNIYIAGEDGGTGESLARLSEMVTDPVEKARLLEASTFFDSPAFYEPLSKNIDDIRTRHANQHIPKITSVLRSFRGTKDAYRYNIAENFWTMVQGRYRYAPGGVGNGEMFRQPYTQIVSMTMNSSRDREGNTRPMPTLNETCCSYNMAKLTKDLNCFNPDDARYMDYYEQVLYNQLVGSLDQDSYRTTYQYAVGLNASKPWGNTTPQSTCCGGTGAENHVKYQEATYFVSDNTLWVGLYMPTTLTWDAKNVTIRQDCRWPAEKSTIKLTDGNANFTLKLRVPYWATSGFDVKLNGVSIASSYQPSSYVTIPARNWTTNDVVEVTMPFSKHIDFGPDKMVTAVTAQDANAQFEPLWAGTLMYGPLAMTATGITDWNQATIHVDSHLEDIHLHGPNAHTGAHGNLYTLTHEDKTFEPDYFRGANSTHYLRIDFVGDPSTEFKTLLFTKLQAAKIFQSKNYTEASYAPLKAAITAGESTHQSDNATESQVSARIEAIDKAIKGLVASGLNKEALGDAIHEAETKAVITYTWDSFDRLQTALKTAKEAFETSEDQSVIDTHSLELSNALSRLEFASRVNKTTLGEAVTLAKERKTAQEAWNALAVKVPEYSPWAPYGFARLVEQLNLAQKVFGNEDKNYNQNETNAAAAALNVAINTMRPGNLPELEDLNVLLTLLSKARSVTSPTPALTESIAFAEMVVEYVGDGSGTHDIPETAVARLKERITE